MGMYDYVFIHTYIPFTGDEDMALWQQSHSYGWAEIRDFADKRDERDL